MRSFQRRKLVAQLSRKHRAFLDLSCPAPVPYHATRCYTAKSAVVSAEEETKGTLVGMVHLTFKSARLLTPTSTRPISI
jgi:hypothetical protein